MRIEPETLAQIATFREARLAYDAALEAHHAPCEARQEAWELSLDLVDATFREIVAYRATSWPALCRKAAYLRASEPIRLDSDMDGARDIAESLAGDIARLA